MAYRRYLINNGEKMLKIFCSFIIFSSLSFAADEFDKDLEDPDEPEIGTYYDFNGKHKKTHNGKKWVLYQSEPEPKNNTLMPEVTKEKSSLLKSILRRLGVKN
jgi:hypothetical protein